MQGFNQVPCPLVVTDQDGIIQSVNQDLLDLAGGDHAKWLSHPIDVMLPVSSRIFLQTHVWPLLLRDKKVREIRLDLLDAAGKPTPVFLNCQSTNYEGIDGYVWVFFVTLERSRFEQELLQARQRAEAVSVELARSERFIRTIADGLPSLVTYWDTQLRCQFANRACAQWLSKTPEQLLGLPLCEVLGESMLMPPDTPYIQQALAGRAQEFESASPAAGRSVRNTLINLIPNKDAAARVSGFFALMTDITSVKKADAAIRLSASVFDATTEGIIVTDANAVIVSVNPAFTRLTGFDAAQAVGQHARILSSGRHDAAFFAAMYLELATHKLWKGEVWSKRRDGSVFLERLCISAICNDAGEIIQYVGLCDDITDRWDKEQLVRRMALHDGLTDLPNRSLLMERLSQLLTMSAREPRHLALMFLDLDGFKAVNDTWGHEMGDHVLRTVAARLLGLVRGSDTVARLGGDEFVILLDNPESRDGVEMVATRVIEVVNAPITFDDKSAHVGTSIGIALFPSNGNSSDELLKHADGAMYAAKAAGKNTYRFA